MRGEARAVLFQTGTWGGWRDSVKFAQSAGHTAPAGPMTDASAAAWLCSIYGPKFLKKR